MTGGNDTGTLTTNYTLVDLELLSNKKATTLIPAMVIVGVLILVGTVGNLLVCYIFCTRLKPNTQHFFILCLAVIDLISCSVAMPGEIADMMYFYTFSSEAACKTLRFFNSMSTFSSVFTLMTIAIDRFRKSCRPHGAQMTRRYARLSLSLVLVLALLCSWPAPIIYGIGSVDVGYSPIVGKDCTISDGVSDTVIPLVFNFLLLVGFLTLTVSIVVLYSLILIGLRRHNRAMSAFKFDVRTSSQAKPKKRLCRLSPMQTAAPNAAVKTTGCGCDSKHQTPLNKLLRRISSNDNVAESYSACCSSATNCGNSTTQIITETSTTSIEGLDSDNSTQITPHDDHRMCTSLNDIILSKDISTTSLNDIILSKDISTTLLNDIILSKDISTTSQCVNDLSNCTLTSNLTASPSYDSCVSLEAISLDEFNSCSFRKELQSEPKTKLPETTSPKISGASRPRNITSKTTTIAFVVTVVFILSYLPHIILQVVKFAHDSPAEEGAELVISNLLVRSYFINSIANPIIYGVFNVQFRQDVRLLVRKILCCNRSSRFMSAFSSTHYLLLRCSG